MPQEIEPIVQTVLVDCPIDDAFRLFTENFGEWWPRQGECDMEPWPDGRIFERTLDGREEEWGQITGWEPPERVEFTWHGGSVEVEFRVAAQGTRVTLIHRDWNRMGEPACSLLARFAWAAQALLAASY